MPNYRRVRVPGGIYFFTVNLLERRRTLLTDHIHYNPVKHGHAASAADWLRHWVSRGVYPQGWAEP